ncbi:MAG: extracellular solute-binding protein [Oribacterium sp.]|nr:extracellular solute-binding protein [Oribacterium sp.]
MINKRIFISGLLTLTLATSVLLSSCSSGNSASQVSGTGDTTITIAARDGSHTDVIKAVIPQFEKDNNCSVKVVSMSADDIHSTVIADAKNDEGAYDVIMIDDPLMPEYIEKNILLNLTQLGYMDDEDFVEKSRLLGKDPYPLGATYSLPFSGNVQLIFYNPDRVSDASSLDSWEGILEECQKASEGGKKGYAIRGQAGNPIVSDFLPILWAFGGDLFDESNNVILDSPESRKALEFYCSLYSTGSNFEKDDLIDAIVSGDAAIALGWPSWFISGDGATASIAQIPGKQSASSEALATGEIGNWLLGVTTNSSNPELALKLAVYLTSSDVQKQALSYGGIPTRKSLFRNPDIIAQYPYFEQIYSGTNNSRVRPRTTKWSRIEEVFGEELLKCINQDQSVDDTIVNSQKSIQALAGE